jgi:thioredoxin-dependent adenylylsulfate APS reductase
MVEEHARLRWNQKGIDFMAQSFEGREPEEVLGWALKEFHPRIALASSFGAEDNVLIDIMYKINPAVRIFTLDTGRLHQETYDIMDKVREKYGIKIKVYYPQTQALENIVRDHGLNLFYKSIELRHLCCQVRKVEPLNRALSDLGAWITGLRRDQAPTRSNIRKVELDLEHNNIVKVNPLAEWTSDEVWNYIRLNSVPYNRLHGKGYPSIGCEPCTRPVRHGEDARTGRWWWEHSDKECGLHSSHRR